MYVCSSPPPPLIGSSPCELVHSWQAYTREQTTGHELLIQLQTALTHIPAMHDNQLAFEYTQFHYPFHYLSYLAQPSHSY